MAVLVGEIDNFPYPGLNDHLGALITGEKPDINATATQVGGDGIEHRIQFGMADIGILGFQKPALALPGQFVIGTTAGKTIVANTDNLVLVVGDACPNRVLGTLSVAPKQATAIKYSSQER